MSRVNLQGIAPNVLSGLAATAMGRIEKTPRQRFTASYLNLKRQVCRGRHTAVRRSSHIRDNQEGQQHQRACSHVCAPSPAGSYSRHAAIHAANARSIYSSSESLIRTRKGRTALSKHGTAVSFKDTDIGGPVTPSSGIAASFSLEAEGCCRFWPVATDQGYS